MLLETIIMCAVMLNGTQDCHHQWAIHVVDNIIPYCGKYGAACTYPYSGKIYLPEGYPLWYKQHELMHLKCWNYYNHNICSKAYPELGAEAGHFNHPKIAKR